jgi:hypothetical protein
MPGVAGLTASLPNFAWARTTKQEARIHHFVRAISVQARRPSLYELK